MTQTVVRLQSLYQCVQAESQFTYLYYTKILYSFCEAKAHTFEFVAKEDAKKKYRDILTHHVSEENVVA